MTSVPLGNWLEDAVRFVKILVGSKERRTYRLTGMQNERYFRGRIFINLGEITASTLSFILNIDENGKEVLALQ